MPHDPRGWHSRGYLPHFDSPERVQHVVFRTHGSLPAKVTPRPPAETDALLDASPLARTFADPALARGMEEALLHFDEVRYRLLGWCVMPNHVHVVIEQLEGHSLGAVVASWKGHVARLVRHTHGAGGTVWAPDYFDRYMRNEAHLTRTLDYVESNPVTAGLVATAEDWLFSSARRRRAAL
jgi:REP element-mobilizing transposase RayT